MIFKEIKSFCVNLDRRRDRWESVQKEFEKIGLAPQRVSAMEGCPPEGNMTWNQTSCLNSHKKIWQMMVDSDIKIAAIFEDDVVFSSDFHGVVNESISEIPKEWELLNLHSTHAGVTSIGRYTNVIVKNLWGSHGYILKKKGTERLLPLARHMDGALSSGFAENGGIPYGIKEEWTVCFQRGEDSDIPETQQLGFWKEFIKKHWR